MGYSLWGHRESDMTEQLSMHTYRYKFGAREIRTSVVALFH